jgi:5-formaminoimidazole-4-carboxamide-1-(beta)-D-ribofuranosyl 5'-monophosphate synthetase
MTHSPFTIATLGSHSALDVCRGAKDLGFRTLVVAEKGREETYAKYYKTVGNVGCVDECIVLNKFDELLLPNVIDELQKSNPIWVPNRSFEAYLHFNYQAIENEFPIPFFGNKYLLKIEERSAKPNQYDLLDKASIPYPKHFSDAKQIDRLCLVKANEKERSFERAFFLAKDYDEFQKKGQEMIKSGKMTQQILDSAVIEEFVLGTQVNFNFFYSPIYQRLELLGTDTRRQTNLDGMLRLPAAHQLAVQEKVAISYEEAGQ